MPIHPIKSHMLASLLFGVSLFTSTMAVAQNQDANALNVTELQRILDAINASNLPDNIKDQLFRDMRTSFIENVHQAEIPDDVKRALIRDLESTSRQ